MRIGIIREEKTPPDSRVPLTPAQCRYIQDKYDIDIYVQPSENRCIKQSEYEEEGIIVTEDLKDCDVLLGVKEVPTKGLLANKTYLFFSHTIKKQSHNRELLQTVLEKNITLIDYEVLTDNKGMRLIAFGHFAGMVGAHNAIWTYGVRSGLYNLPRMKDCMDYEHVRSFYTNLKLPPLKIVLTGTGRVGTGALEILQDMGIRQVSPEDFLTKEFNEAVFTQLQPHDYAARKDNKQFDKQTFYDEPKLFKGIFSPYTKVSDIMINGIYWDNDAPVFFTKEEMKSADFKIEVIADITCDIAPVASIPSTVRASTIADPVFGYEPHSESEVEPYQDKCVDMMTIDNLPNELPRDASKAFGEMFIRNIFEDLIQEEQSDMIKRATVAKNGKLGQYFEYLENYVRGLE